ncbi:HK97 family phage prohead protease [Mycobacterium kansasii]|uniref:HK97 family phage prohead protease n=1 Tax=Mycobacterium kansasii TaxID=1768 RepID=UPI0018DC9BD1|nr:HK97 family phage prohead protease [Mycobacterium kansasii]
MKRPPLEGAREVPFFMRADEPNDGFTLDGYGAVFNRLTVIDSWEGRFREQFAPGSMKRSFRETPPKIQFDHGRHPLIGSIPIASLRSITEDVHPELAPEGGAHIIARIFDNWLMQPVRDAIAEGAISGMSHRFGVVRVAWTYADGKPIRDERALITELERAMYENVSEDELPIRTVKEARILEMGPVVWPAYQQTSVGVRSIDLGRLRDGDPEQRRLLAEMVFVADTASMDEEAQRDTTPPGVVVEHPESSDDAQRSTPECVGERPSKSPKPLTNMQLRLMNQRDRLSTFRQVGERSQ